MASSPFASFFMAGFECSTQRRRDGRRLDLVKSTHHDERIEEDYRACAELGMRTLRDGLRWHLIETAPGQYDWSSWLPMVRAARAAGVQVIWDICHYGWPEFYDLWTPEWVDAFARFAEAAARVFRDETDATPLWCPVNEISFFTWSAGDVGYFFPAETGRGPELKRQLVRAAIKGSQACLRVDHRARLIWCEPMIKVEPVAHLPEREAADMHASQFEAFDMIAGRRDPDLGGRPELLDIVGLNYYPHNQWYFRGPTIPMGHHAYTDMGELLEVVGRRYGRPLLISETGAERNARAPWLHYVCEEVRGAMASGVDVLGICLYPVLAYPGWDNDRHCDVGLFGTPVGGGDRSLYRPLADEIRRQEAVFAALSRAPSEGVQTA
jgi:beta-glucosidase/6-phospho-beta-glucosidase/beta-galactosidase